MIMFSKNTTVLAVNQGCHNIFIQFFTVDGGFTSWSDWSCCSRSCGNGTKVRYRSCTNPAPANGGLECTGERNQTESCLGTSCPGNCLTASIQMFIKHSPREIS